MAGAENCQWNTAMLIPVFDDPPYSPDLAPSGYLIFLHFTYIRDRRGSQDRRYELVQLSEGELLY